MKIIIITIMMSFFRNRIAPDIRHGNKNIGLHIMGHVCNELAYMGRAVLGGGGGGLI